MGDFEMKKLISLAALVAFTGVAGNVLAAGNAAAGKTRSATCAACHGVDGNSAAPNFPKLAGMDGQYIARQLADFKSGARKDPLMSGMAAPLSKKDMDDLGAYYAGQKRTGGVANLNDHTRKTAENLYRGGSPNLGIAACMSCHGPAGTGIPPRFPAVGGQHASYNEKQLKDFKSGARKNDGNVMGPIAFRLSEAEIKAVAEYMAGLH
jgi:cytochrome c553